MLILVLNLKKASKDWTSGEKVTELDDFIFRTAKKSSGRRFTNPNKQLFQNKLEPILGGEKPPRGELFEVKEDKHAGRLVRRSELLKAFGRFFNQQPGQNLGTKNGDLCVTLVTLDVFSGNFGKFFFSSKVNHGKYASTFLVHLVCG